MTRYIIIGDGGAGTTAAYFIRRADATAQIEIYSDDPNAAYYRAALTNYLSGELREAQLFATPPDFYETNNIKRVLGRVASVDSEYSRLSLVDGTEVFYDQLLIAAGASPNPPSFPGVELPGVMTMRTLQDARKVMDFAASKRLRQAVVVGGGPLGIEWVQGLMHQHVKVTYLLRDDMFFKQVLDRTASDLVISRLRSEGVDVRTNEEIGEALPGKDGRLRAIRLKNSGQEIECQLVGSAIGIRPNVDFLQGSGVEVAKDQKGIVVNEYMRTNIPNIYAAGDILFRTLGLWEPARHQGRIAGSNMANPNGASEAYHQGIHYNATRLYDLDFAGVGEVMEKPDDQVLIDFPKGSGRVAYRKLIIRGDKLVGAILLGQRKEQVRKYGMHYRKLIDKAIDISAVSNNLLDASFDLAGWLDSQEIGDQIDIARQIKVQLSGASPADMRKTRNDSNTNFFTQSKVNIKAPDAILQHGDTRIPLKSSLRIGRKPENDLVLSESNVSGAHAQIRLEKSVYVLEDLKSSNGTFLNDIKINEPVPLQDGASIRIGDTKLLFVFADSIQNLRLTSAGLPEAPTAQPAQSTDPTWGILQVGERDFPLRTASLNIGRDPKADIVLDDLSVSYLHAHIVRQGTDSYLRDLGSRNGTYVNGTLVSVAHALQNGDVIQLGGSSLIFRSDSLSQRIQTVPFQKDFVLSNVSEEPIHANTPKEFSLSVRGGSMLGQSFSLKLPLISIGRNPKSDIVLRDETVSWSHASIKKEGAQWFISDLNSGNGIFLNDQKLDAQRAYPIQAGDRLRLGDTLLEVNQDAN